jgi:hypothetical protein
MQIRTILPERITIVFNDPCVQRLGLLAKLPRGADMQAFAAGVRDAAFLYAGAARQPNSNQVRAEIRALYRSAARRDFGSLAELLENLSDPARLLLSRRHRPAAVHSVPAVAGQPDRPRRSAIRPRVERGLPAPADLRDPMHREHACVAVERLCLLGGRYADGRRRPSGRRSRPNWQPELYAPPPSRHFAKRAAEREFVTLLRFAWLEATGKQPARTARHDSPGPFARLVDECLRLVGAPYADAIELINDLHRRRGPVT